MSDIMYTTTHKVVVPFYVYAGLAFLLAALMLFTSSGEFSGHYFQPHILAITHTMALGWGTMIILGASHQLLPVLIEGKLYSIRLAYIAFACTAVGILLLVWAFYDFDMGWPAKIGALLVNVGVVVFLVNVVMSIIQSKTKNIQAYFMLTATGWLFFTTLVGGLLVCNFSEGFLPKDSLHYLSLHAHIGIVGWFLLLVMGVGSRLIPMFLISKYEHPKMLWRIYWLANGGLILFICIFLNNAPLWLYLVPVAAVTTAIILFAVFCENAYRVRIRRQVDEEMKVSLLAVVMMVLPLIFLITIIIMLISLSANVQLVLAYGFTIFFGWLTAIILGMTFKTLPFIIWNKIYHAKAGTGKTPNPKDLFSNSIFNTMAVCFIIGFVGFAAGIITSSGMTAKTGALLLLGCAFLYNMNVFKLLFHKEVVL
ncbi:cytochrome C oxidase subunit I [Chitinophaga sp.]|uniref:cytochrome C oxidase subunit I n=1 Tax=Chitinophaga sp. TaxID=1869181 RepID=UPI0031DB5D1E